MIPYGKQDISSEDIRAVEDVLKSDFLTQGPTLPRFEQAVADYCGSSNAIAVCNATSALHIACLALGVSEGDIVWTSPISFVASANCALYCGAHVDFVDIDIDSGLMSVEALELKLHQAQLEGVLPKVVIPVHLCGQSCDMIAIHRLAIKFGFSIIEDASHAIGGIYDGQKIGSCQYSDICVFSFHPVKIITTAEGGLATTNNPDVAERMKMLRSHGITRDKNKMKHRVHGPWYYEQLELGMNYRMTEMQAALGLSQLSRLNEFVERRHMLANEYHKQLVKQPYQHFISPLIQRHSQYSSYHLFIIRLHNTTLSRQAIFEKLRSAGIGVNVHYIPIHTQPYFRSIEIKPIHLPQAEKFYTQIISLPLHPNLTTEDVTYICNELLSAINP